MVPEQKEEIIRLTEEYGGQWGINHTRRLLRLIRLIGEGLTYDEDIVWTAAHLHDWGGYPHWLQPCVDHALRSRQVAESYLTSKGYPSEFVLPVLAAIEYHHLLDPARRIESLLLSDADALDFLGVVGLLRDFSKKPGDLRKARETVQARRQKLPPLLCLEKSKQLAAARLQSMDQALAAFEEETFGLY